MGVTAGSRAGNAHLGTRFVVFIVLVVIVLTTLTARLFTLQIANGTYYNERADLNRVVLQPVRSSRGLILDRSGRPVVANVPTFTVRVTPADLQYSRRDAVVARLSSLLGMQAVDINEAIDANPGSRFDSVRIAVDVPEDVARIISEERLQLPGVEVAVESRREYPQGTLLSQVLGYPGPVDAEELRTLREKGYLADDVVGKTGVEAVYESYLRGQYGVEQVERDASGRKLQVLSTVREPEAGASLQLTIDLKTQKEAEQALKWGMGAAKLKKGVVIVMNPQTGEILAMVSLPTYDNNLFARGISSADFAKLTSNPNQPLVNHAVADQYPPGSTYKLVPGTGALADGKITTGTKLETRPYLEIGTDRFVEWNGRGWGMLDIYGGFSHSSDTFFYQVAAKLGIDRLAYWARQFGFGRPTGIDLPAEASGTVPSNAWKQDVFGQTIFPGETYLAGIGQGYDMVTPLQLLNAYAALANGGKLYQPQVVRQIVGANGEVLRPFAPKLIRKLKADASVLRVMRVAARQVVTSRHTGNLVDLPLVIAGKTGTAEFGTRDSQGNLPFHTWFVAFVPKSGDAAKPDAQLAVIAFAYDSSRSVGNVATEIVKYFLQLHYDLKVDLRDLRNILPNGGN
jgi:penicillin-binding protein 2